MTPHYLTWKVHGRASLSSIHLLSTSTITFWVHFFRPTFRFRSLSGKTSHRLCPGLLLGFTVVETAIVWSAILQLSQFEID